MKYFFATIVSLLTVLILSAPAFAASSDGKAGVQILPALFFDQSSTNDGTTKTTNTVFILDAAVGYKFSMGFYVGGDYYDYNYTSSPSPGSSTTNTLTSYGPEIGFLKNGWSFRGGYDTGGSYKISTGAASTSYDSGSGYHVAVAYAFMVSEHFSLGPMVKYMDMTFTKFTNAAGTQTTLTQNYEVTHLDPYLLLQFTF